MQLTIGGINFVLDDKLTDTSGPTRVLNSKGQALWLR